MYIYRLYILVLLGFYGVDGQNLVAQGDKFNFTLNFNSSESVIFWTRNSLNIYVASVDARTGSGCQTTGPIPAGFSFYCLNSGSKYIAEITSKVEDNGLALTTSTYSGSFSYTSFDNSSSPSTFMTCTQPPQKVENSFDLICTTKCTHNPSLTLKYQAEASGSTVKLISGTPDISFTSCGSPADLQIAKLNYTVAQTDPKLSEFNGTNNKVKIIIETSFPGTAVVISQSTNYFYIKPVVKCIVVIMAIVGIVVMVFGELIVITGIFVCYYYNKKKEIGSWTGKICGIIITGLILIIIGIALFFSFNESKGTFGACAVEIVFIILIIIGIILLIICIVVLCLFNKKKDSQDQPDPPPAVPGQPLNITFLPAEADQICLTWTASGNGGDKQKFIVQHSTDGKTWTDSTPISDNSYCIKNLRPDTEYSIQVKAGNVAGYGKPQKVNRIKTKKIDSSSTAVGKRRREDPENGVELTDRVRTPLNS